MLNYILNTFLWTFFFYGLFHFLFSLFSSIRHFKNTNQGIYLFIAVKNQEDEIEGFVRSLLYQFFLHPEKYNQIYLVDLNSTDQTSDILKKISKDYLSVQCTNLSNCQKILDTISEKK